METPRTTSPWNSGMIMRRDLVVQQKVARVWNVLFHSYFRLFSSRVLAWPKNTVKHHKHWRLGASSQLGRFLWEFLLGHLPPVQGRTWSTVQAEYLRLQRDSFKPPRHIDWIKWCTILDKGQRQWQTSNSELRRSVLRSVVVHRVSFLEP